MLANERRKKEGKRKQEEKGEVGGGKEEWLPINGRSRVEKGKGERERERT